MTSKEGETKKGQSRRWEKERQRPKNSEGEAESPGGQSRDWKKERQRRREGETDQTFWHEDPKTRRRLQEKTCVDFFH